MASRIGQKDVSHVGPHVYCLKNGDNRLKLALPSPEQKRSLYSGEGGKTNQASRSPVFLHQCSLFDREIFL